MRLRFISACGALFGTGIVCLLFASGCASAAKRYSSADATPIERYRSTRDDVRATLGLPHEVIEDEGGEPAVEHWVYFEGNGAVETWAPGVFTTSRNSVSAAVLSKIDVADARRIAVVISFDAEGRVVEIQSKETTP